MLLRPALIIAVDPDGCRTALASARWDDERDGYRYLGSVGGGASKTRVGWQTITGQLRWLDAALAREGVASANTLAVVETQAADSLHTRAVEPLRRVRYHLEAACELRGIVFKSVTIAWAQTFVPGASAQGRAAQKRAYRKKAKALTNGETTNEDRCAAFGILAVEIEDLGFNLYKE